MMSDFTNGTIVAKVWRFDGGSDMVAKFQNFADACAWAKLFPYSTDWFYVAVCSSDPQVRAFGVNEPRSGE